MKSLRGKFNLKVLALSVAIMIGASWITPSIAIDNSTDNASHPFGEIFPPKNIEIFPGGYYRMGRKERVNRNYSKSASVSLSSFTICETAFPFSVNLYLTLLSSKTSLSNNPALVKSFNALVAVGRCSINLARAPKLSSSFSDNASRTSSQPALAITFNSFIKEHKNGKFLSWIEAKMILVDRKVYK